mmetsp:Transcript_57003/g.121031  ORF Transcript_57003/g.121031 Transcript_57003/m.121031 type:complete len:213 (-) Transcript_57003:111-749(-)
MPRAPPSSPWTGPSRASASCTPGTPLNRSSPACRTAAPPHVHFSLSTSPNISVSSPPRSDPLAHLSSDGAPDVSSSGRTNPPRLARRRRPLRDVPLSSPAFAIPFDSHRLLRSLCVAVLVPSPVCHVLLLLLIALGRQKHEGGNGDGGAISVFIPAKPRSRVAPPTPPSMSSPASEPPAEADPAPPRSQTLPPKTPLRASGHPTTSTRGRSS